VGGVMTIIDQSGIRGKIRDRPISDALREVLSKAGRAAGIDTIFVTSGGQPGTKGRSKGSTRHNGGRAADLHLMLGERVLQFTDDTADDGVVRFVTAAAAHGATGIGAGEAYMGTQTLHVGFGKTPSDTQKLVWGAKGASRNAPLWLKEAAERGWNAPPAWVEADEFADEDSDEEAHDVAPHREFGEERLEVPDRFTHEVIRAAQATQRRWGIPASVTLAQWAIESAYGTQMPLGSNNPFGIKALSGQQRVLAWTTEFKNGRPVKVREPFRAFASLEEAFLDHGRLLGTSRHYAKARKFLNNPDRFADALTGIYATDPGYGSKLKKIMSSNNLYAFNELPERNSESFPDFEEFRPLQRGDKDEVRVKALQSRLVMLGYKLGKIDGKFGSLTAGALLAFQSDNEIPTTGVLDLVTEQALASAEHRRFGDDRTKKTEEGLGKDGSKIVNDAGWSRILSWIAAGLGAVGIGNSAVVNSVESPALNAGSALQERLLPFLDQVQALSTTNNEAAIANLKQAAAALAQQAQLSPDAVRLLTELRPLLPADLATRYPELSTALNSLGGGLAEQPQHFRTIFDILPTFFANDSVLQTAMQGVATVGASVLPGFGGSLAVLGLGLAGRFFANRIARNRLEDHQTGGNINPLDT
jgi:flagellum-specific peptidoglycan hydrolase FlgJ/peptidoglycan hydrolase-like protein with peptidoglycan-binding domain